MSEINKSSQLEDVAMPAYYSDYYKNISNETYKIFEIAAKSKGHTNRLLRNCRTKNCV